MRIPQATGAAVERFHRLTPTGPSITVKPMFGNLAAFVNGNLFFGVFADQLFVRLAEPDRVEASEDSGFVAFEPMPGRSMREYLVLPEAVLADPERSKEWVARSLAYVTQLPAKKSMPRSK